jgi:AcrR family transcriptional regulator
MNGESTEVRPAASEQAESVLGSRDSVASSSNQVTRSAGRPPDARRQEQRRSEILEAATNVFARVGFAATDVQEIAALAGVGKGTVYRYFPSKEELFLATVDLGMRRLTTTVDSAAAKASDPLTRIASAIEAYLAYFDQHPEIIELFIQERAHFRHRQQATYFAHRDANIGAWRQLLVELIRDGLVRDLPVDSLLEVISDLLYGTLFTKQISGRKESLASQSEPIMQVIMKGILVAPATAPSQEDRRPADHQAPG